MNKIAFTFALVTALTAASSSALAQFGVGEATVNVTAQPNEVQNLVITKQRDLYLGDIIYNVIDSNSPAVYGVGHSYVFNRRNLLCGSSYIINNNINVYNRRSGSAAEVLFEGDAESLVQLSFSNIEDQATDPYIVLTGENTAQNLNMFLAYRYGHPRSSSNDSGTTVENFNARSIALSSSSDANLNNGRGRFGVCVRGWVELTNSTPADTYQGSFIINATYL